jgi:hypothetical protein
MVLYLKKFFTAFSCFLLIPAIGCLCCEVSHADEVSHKNQTSSCCKEEGNHEEAPCCSDCLLQGIPRENSAFVISTDSKSSEKPEVFEPFFSAGIITGIISSHIQEIPANVSPTNFSLVLIPVSSYPIQGRSPPITS